MDILDCIDNNFDIVFQYRFIVYGNSILILLRLLVSSLMRLEKGHMRRISGRVFLEPGS